MREWREIVSDIYDALEDFDVDVEYVSKSGHGYDATCSYFEITLNDDDIDTDDVDDALSDVCDEWDLEIDYCSDADLDLNACWDIND